MVNKNDVFKEILKLGNVDSAEDTIANMKEAIRIATDVLAMMAEGYEVDESIISIGSREEGNR
jgi:hypothetical protein